MGLGAPHAPHGIECGRLGPHKLKQRQVPNSGNRPISRKRQHNERDQTSSASLCNRLFHAVPDAKCRGPGFAWKSLCKGKHYLFGPAHYAASSSKLACFLNLALASVSSNAVQVARTQNPEVRELRVAPFLASTCARQKARYV